MREVGLEPTRVSSLPPQSSASANSATPAKRALDLSVLEKRNQEIKSFLVKSPSSF